MRSSIARPLALCVVLGGVTALMPAISIAAAAEFQTNAFVRGDQEKPAVARLAAGGFAVTWQSTAQDDIGQSVYGRRYTAAGAVAGDEFRINNTAKSMRERPAIAALADGGFVVVWTSQRGSAKAIRGQRYTATGAEVGNEFRVTPAADDAGFEPAVAALAGGGFVVVWTSFDASYFGVYGQRFSAAGIKVGDRFLVNLYTEDPQQRPAIAALEGGGFVVVWDSFWQDDGLTSGVYGQRYAANGDKIGGPFRINQTTAADQFEPRVATLSSGGFVVVWTSNDDDRTGILGQRYSRVGERQGREFRVNTEQAGVQADADVAPIAAGGFVVVWQSADQDGSGLGVYGQRYTARVPKRATNSE